MAIGGIGGIAAAVSYFCIRLRQRFNLDESLDVWACLWHGRHHRGTAHRPLRHHRGQRGGRYGLFYGNAAQLGKQAAAGIVIVFSFAGTFVLAKVLDWTMGLRVSPDEEEVGLDISSHGERAFV